MLSSHHDMFFCVEGTYNIFVFSPLFFPGRKSDFSHEGVGERDGKYCSALFPLLPSLGTRFCFSIPGVLQGHTLVWEGLWRSNATYYWVGKSDQLLTFNTEKPTVVIHQKPHSPKPVLPVFRVISFHLPLLCLFLQIPKPPSIDTIMSTTI